MDESELDVSFCDEFPHGHSGNNIYMYIYIYTYIYIYGCVPFVPVHDLGPIPGHLEDRYGHGRAGPASGGYAYGPAV